MYKISESTDTAEARHKAQEAPPFGPGFPAGIALQATHLEIWGTTFADAGDGYTEFRIFAGPTLLGARRTEGF
jgi:hypothetical protein